MIINKKFCFAFLLALFLLSNVSASYITGNIYLDEKGGARFDVETDVEIFLEGVSFQNNRLTGTTNQLLMLRGGVWTFDLSSVEYDDIFLEIHLPKNLAAIKSISGSDSIINIEEKIITIADSGKLRINLSYILQEKKNYYWVYWLMSIIVLLIVFFIYKRITKKKERFENILPIINEKEQQIINLLMKKPFRQKELRKTLNLPKASFSRYMVNLEKKKLIVREGEGKNKLVRLK